MVQSLDHPLIRKGFDQLSADWLSSAHSRFEQQASGAAVLIARTVCLSTRIQSQKFGLKKTVAEKIL